MKWGTIISCLLLTGFAEFKNLPRRYQDVEHQVPKSQSRIELLKDMDMENIFVEVFSQFLQRATFDEVHKLVEDAAIFSKKCFADGFAGPGCNDSLFSFFPDQICAAKGLPEKYGYADCCTKAGSERYDCLISHKNATPGFLPPFQKPDPEEVCTQFQAKPEETVQRFIYEYARRDPIAMAQSFFVVTNVHKKLLTTCCQAAEKEPCFKQKPPVSKRELEYQFEPPTRCFIVTKFGTRALESLEHILLSQQFPRASVSAVFSVAKHLAEAQINCCRGDSVRCFFSEKDAEDYLCGPDFTISSKQKEVCERGRLEGKTLLLSFGDNDDKPSDLPPIAREFIEDKDLCRHYAENQAAHLGKFRYENGRRHPELPQYLLLRHADEYENLLKNCCTVEHPEQCLPQGEGQLEKQIADTLELVNMNCDLYDKLGNYGFQNALLVSFSKNVPQLSFEELYQYTKELNEAASECCHWNDTKNLACSERKVETVLGRICLQHQQKAISAQIDKCCSGPFPFWMQCFAGLRVDADYTHAAFEPTFHSDLCLLDATNLKKTKQMLLVRLIKDNPDITEEQLAVLIADLQTFLTECCEAEKKEECFKEEGQKLTDRIKALSGRH